MADWATLDPEKLELTAYVQPDPSELHLSSSPSGDVLKLVRGSSRRPQCNEGPSAVPRPTPPPSAPPWSFRDDPFAGMPPAPPRRNWLCTSVRAPRARVRAWARGLGGAFDAREATGEGVGRNVEGVWVVSSSK